MFKDIHNAPAQHDPSYLRGLIAKPDPDANHIAYVLTQLKGLDFSVLSENLSEKYDREINVMLFYPSNIVYPQVAVICEKKGDSNIFPAGLKEDAETGTEKQGLEGLELIFRLEEAECPTC